MKGSRFGLAQYLVAELMAVVERRRRRTNCCAAAERERIGNGVKLKEWRRVTRIRTKDSDSTATMISAVMAANGLVVGVPDERRRRIADGRYLSH